MICKGKTKSGKTCKNKAVVDGYCRLHYIGTTTNFSKDILKEIAYPKDILKEIAYPKDIIKEAMKSFESFSGLAKVAMGNFSIPNYFAKGAMKSFESFSGLAKVAMGNSSIPDDIFANIVPGNNFEMAFKEVVLKVRAKKNENIDEAILTVANDIEKSSMNNPISFLSIEFYLNLIIVLMVLAYSSISQKQMEKNIVNTITESEKTIIENFREQFQNQLDYTYYVVLRAVQLKTKPHSKKGSTTISYLYQNQIARLVDRKGKWIRVEYFNHISGVHEKGWCLKKYLKHLGRIKIPHA